jgi:serine/threonine protein kinase
VPSSAASILPHVGRIPLLAAARRALAGPMSAGATRRFRVGPCLGRGGFGEVYRATMCTEGGLETEVALKVLRAEVADADAMARFRDEGRMLSRFQHPVVVRAHDWARLQGTTTLVTEYVDGVDASAVVGAIPLRPALEVVAAVASALDAAWSAPGPDGRPLRIVHRDLKPTNLRLGRHGHVKLLDFGIAVLGTDDRESHTRSALIVGSLPYMAPERFTDRVNTPPVDVYGLGCCLFELLTGRVVHPGSRLKDLTALSLDGAAFDEHVARQVAAMPAPDAVRELTARCLAHDPARRPTASALAAECGRLSAEVGGTTLRRYCGELPAGSPPAPGPWTGLDLEDGAAAPELAADRSRAAVVTAPRATMHPDDPPPPRPAAATFDLPRDPAADEVPARSWRLMWLLAGAGCVAVGALLVLGVGGLAAAAGAVWALW